VNAFSHTLLSLTDTNGKIETDFNVFRCGWNESGGGLPGGARSVIPGQGTPPVPENLQVTSVDDITVTMTYCGSCAAAGYRKFF
jgi:hypothetical protein